MPNLILRLALSAIVLLFAPTASIAADTAAAMLYGNGTTWVNGGSIPKSSAIFSGDLIQTKADSVANINSPGTSVTISPDSLIQFQGSSVKIEHGAVTVSTSKTMAAQAGALTVKPVSTAWTEFDVKNVDGTIQIVARKGELLLQDENGTSTLSEGQQATRSESSASERRKKAGGAAPAAVGPPTSSTAAYVVGAGAAGGLAIWVFKQGDDPISPSKFK